ncbi:MAG: 3-phosphoshikimate 1-carboxyvinyltransferase, partial [Clostridia bacterium]|nr:3-phosphoshikimate 1-carboxyvinyltransferase [Clostridia bacterium]
MIATIQPGRAAGRVRAPASKSMAHRILIAGALSAHSFIKGVEFSDDIKATLHCLAALGADIHCEGSQVEIGGFRPEHPVVRPLLPCGESGSTLRFMIPLCLLTGQKIVLKGTERLMQRSLAVYEELCASQGILLCREKDRVGVQGRLTP